MIPASEKDSLIVEQQLEIRNLKQRLDLALKDKAQIASILTCIGGALNDNIFGYTPQQKAELHKIKNLAEAEV